MNKLLSAFFFLIFLSFLGCSTVSNNTGPDSLRVRVGNSESGVIDGDIERESKALHAFLVGQLSYQKEDMQTAVRALSETSDLLEEPEPLINIQLAQLSLHQGDLNRALNEIRKARRDSPADLYLRYYEAGILDAQEDFTQAVEAYKRIIATNISPEAVILLASVHHRAGQNQAAINALDDITLKDPSLKLYQALLYEESENFSKAVEVLKKHLKQKRDNVVVDFVLVRNLVLSGDFAGAKSHLSQMAEVYKDNPIVIKVSEASGYVSTAESLLALIGFTPTPKEELDNIRLELALRSVQERQFQGALRDILLHLSIHPDDSTARYYLASIFAGAGRRKQAVEEIFKIQPGQEMYVKGRTFAAFILRQDGNLDLAEKAARDALAEEPENQKIITYLILILRAAGKYDEAENILAEAVESDPKNDRFLFSYAVVLNDLNQPEKSLNIMKRVIEVNPDNSDALNYIAYSYAEAGKNLNEALSLSNRALNLRPNDGFYLDTLGWIYFKLGRFEEAEQTLRKAMQLTDDDVVIAEHYGDVLSEVGKKNKAQEIYRIAIEKARDRQDPEEDIIEARYRMEEKLKKLIGSSEE